MQPVGSGKKSGAKRAWQAPAVTKLPIGTQTRSSPPAAADAGQPVHPEPPGTPSTKLGLSFELAFPLSARFGE
jgi:hypothetical protein